MAKLWFVSDTDFVFYTSAVKRGYENALRMYEHIREVWNSRVSDSDCVYMVGGLAYAARPIPDLLGGLNGILRIVLGPKDRRKYYDGFRIIPDRSEIWHPSGVRFLLTYYPLSAWRDSDKVINVHGYNTCGPRPTSAWVSLTNKAMGMGPRSAEEILDEVFALKKRFTVISEPVAVAVANRMSAAPAPASIPTADPVPTLPFGIDTDI